MANTARLQSSHVQPFFSEQSHLLFYGRSSSPQCKPIKTHLHTDLTLSLPLTSRPGAKHPPVRSASHPSSTSMTAFNTRSELDLLKELAVLKAQVKLKKKQLKAIAKEKKTELKKSKAKTKGHSSTSTSSSSSSSSSEASDGGRMSSNIRLFKKKSLLQNRDEGDVKQGVAVRGESHGLDHIYMSEDRNDGIAQCMPLWNEPSVEQAYSQSTRCSDRDDATAGPPHAAIGTGRAHGISGSIEVCVGGKCKKAGSHQLLSSFKAQIPASACVDAIPCKCMGRCGAAINVKVRKEDTNPQHHSHVRVDDVGLILSHHFGLGPPLSGLPSFSSLPPTPSVFKAQV